MEKSPTADRVCRVCGASLIGYRDVAAYCSRACKDGARPAPVPWATRAAYDRWKDRKRWARKNGREVPRPACRTCGDPLDIANSTGPWCSACRVEAVGDTERTCVECGSSFSVNRARPDRCCSQACGSRAGGRATAEKLRKSESEKPRRWHGPQRRRIIAALVERDGDRCGICRKRIDLTIRHKWGKPPEPRGVSIDHVVPWSEMRDNSLPNLRLAHFECNNRRGTGRAADQLALI